MESTHDIIEEVDMPPISRDGITDHKLTYEEFNLLGLIDSRHFIESASLRFKHWQSSFDTSHADWRERTKVQDKLATLTAEAIHALSLHKTPIKVLFIGAALGAIPTYFHAARFKQYGFLENTKIDICDLLYEPLEMTIKGEFDFQDQVAISTGLYDLLTPQAYKSLLRSVNAFSANAIRMDTVPDATYDVVIASYFHHHLNFSDKALACAEMSRITRSGGVCAVGDLTFNYSEFSHWLRKHAEETIPYALECFISRQEHQSLLQGTSPLLSHDDDIYYSFIVKKE